MKNVKHRVVIITCKRSLAWDYLITFLEKVFQSCSVFYFTFICIFVALLWLLCSHLGNANHLWFMGHLDCVCSCFVSSDQWKAAETDSSTLCFLHSKFLLICHPPPSIILHTPLFAFHYLGFILQIWGIPPIFWFFSLCMPNWFLILVEWPAAEGTWFAGGDSKTFLLCHLLILCPRLRECTCPLSSSSLLQGRAPGFLFGVEDKHGASHLPLSLPVKRTWRNRCFPPRGFIWMTILAVGFCN